jgi:hypothetical protein
VLMRAPTGGSARRLPCDGGPGMKIKICGLSRGRISVCQRARPDGAALSSAFPKPPTA